MLPESFLSCLATFEPCFTSPTYQRFLTIMTGWVLCVGKRTVTGVIRAAGVVGRQHHSGYHRFFSQAVWSTDPVGLALMRLILTLPGIEERVILNARQAHGQAHRRRRDAPRPAAVVCQPALLPLRP